MNFAGSCGFIGISWLRDHTKYQKPWYYELRHLHYSNWRLKICIWRLYFSSWSPKGDLRIYIISSLVLATEVYAWTVTLLSHKRSTRCPLIYHHLILTLDWKFCWYILFHFVTKWNSKPWHIFKVVIKALLCSVWAHKDYFERLSFWNYLFIALNQLWCECSAWWALQKKVPQASHWRDSGQPIKLFK